MKNIDISTAADELPTLQKTNTPQNFYPTFFAQKWLAEGREIYCQKWVKKDRLEPQEPQDGNQETRGDVSLNLDQDTISVAEGKSASIAVTLTNNRNTGTEYILSLENVDDFAEPASGNTVFLSTGQTSTVFLNLKAKTDIAGTYSGAIKIKDNAGTTIATEVFTVEVTGHTKQPGLIVGISLEGSKVFWIICDVILIIVAIFFLKLIFSGSKKKQTKMADMAPVAMRKQ